MKNDNNQEKHKILRTAAVVVVLGGLASVAVIKHDNDSSSNLPTLTELTRGHYLSYPVQPGETPQTIAAKFGEGPYSELEASIEMQEGYGNKAGFPGAQVDPGEILIIDKNFANPTDYNMVAYQLKQS